MSIRYAQGSLVANCDGAGCSQRLPASDFNTLKRYMANAGWYGVKESGAWFNFCSKCSAKHVKTGKPDAAFKPRKKSWVSKARERLRLIAIWAAICGGTSMGFAIGFLVGRVSSW